MNSYKSVHGHTTEQEAPQVNSRLAAAYKGVGLTLSLIHI